MPVSTARLALAATLIALPAMAQGPATGYRTGILSDHDRRIRQEPDAWPWVAIGKVNVVFGPSRRGSCTGVLIAPDKVATAGHCLFNQTTKRWADSNSVHFLAGAARGGQKAHARAKSFAHADDFDPAFVTGGGLAPEMLWRDWAILTLEQAIDIRPVPLRPIADADFASALADGETARAGYGQDRPFLLSLQRGCAVRPVAAWPGLLAHDCDTMQGDSGSPILLTRGDDAWVIGLSTAVS